MIARIFCVFCTDVRHEVGNSESYIGVFHPNFSLPRFPALLPTISVVVHAAFPKTEIPKSIRVWAVVPWLDSPVFDKSLSSDQLRGQEPDDEAEYLQVRLTSKTSLFEVREPGRFRVYAEIDGEKMQIGALRFMSPPQAEIDKLEQVS